MTQALGVDEHQVVKTLMMEDDRLQHLIRLMHGDREVVTGVLARQIGAKRIQLCAPPIADKHSGYQVGGTSPFASRRTMPIYCERSILRWSSADLERLLPPQRVEAAV